MGLFGLFGRKKEVELNKVKDDNKEKFLREPNDNEEGILQFENLNFKLAVIQVLMYDLNLFILLAFQLVLIILTSYNLLGGLLFLKLQGHQS